MLFTVVAGIVLVLGLTVLYKEGAWPFRKSWEYLGYSEISYVNEKNPSEVFSKWIIHYYGKGKDLNKRKIRVKQTNGCDRDHKTHAFYQKHVVPWLNGGEWIAFGIEHRSTKLDVYIKDTLHYRYDKNAGKWVKRVQGELTDD